MPLSLSDSVLEIKGVGAKTAASLEKAGIKTIRDLLYYLPRTYENYQATTSLKDIRPGRVCVRGKITDLKVNYTSRRNLNLTEGVIYDKSDAIRAVWFNQPYRAKQFEPDKEYFFTGNYDYSHNRYQLTSPTARLASDVEKDEAKGSSFKPIYRSKGSFKSENFQKIFSSLRSEFANIPDLLPITEDTPDFVKPGVRSDSLYRVHFAENSDDVETGRHYLAYEELFELILAANLNREESSKLKSLPIPFDQKATKSLVSRLPFALTNAQRRASWEILQDLGRDLPMNRLLQGDVGSGKTVVAALAAHTVAHAGYQTALLAPTAILATQHADSLDKLLSPFGVRVALLIGSTKNKPKLKERIKNGEVDLVIGTHALITDDTDFKNLALCIIDEQHRFGVNQRQKLLTKTSIPGTAPHLLSMSATPIPRSLQLSIFGDLAVSTLDELPAGRQPITTTILPDLAMTDLLYPKIHNFLATGQQVYWICKTIEGKSNSTSVKKMADHLQPIFPKAKIAYLHGRMKAEEKDAIMSDFAARKIDILVSTTVVEVGVNVPNANLMVIMDSESYGLAQIHQLRGRVGRGDQPAYCYLITSGDNPPTRRLRELEHSTDGFYLAEVDLKIRGPGEIYGSLQHGALNLNIATLTDLDLVAKASKSAKSCARAFASDPELFQKYPELASCIQKYQQLTTLN
ncbi:ATP-dependent DNA helicase RecG [Candidatus Saccharibacteria bacterium]|nr:ATP-dependent DNA helicase RecG [Candidatus Saccharibacteria bacterium]